MAIRGAQYGNNLFPNRIRGCKRRLNQNDGSHCLPAKIPVTEQEMSSRLYSLSLDQIDISHFLLYPHTSPIQQHQYAPPTYPVIPAATDTLTCSQPNDECSSSSDEETDTSQDLGPLLTREKLRLAIDKTTEILPRDIIDSILNAYPSPSCTAIAVWEPKEILLHLTNRPDLSTETEDTSTEDIDRNTEYFDEVMDIDCV